MYICEKSLGTNSLMTRIHANKFKLILASKSPRRIEFLRDLGIDFICHPAHIDENNLQASPEKFPVILAREKAAAVAELYPNDLVLGADTIVSIDEHIIGKPKDIADAEKILLSLSGRTHKVISGVCLIRKADSILHAFSDVSFVQFKNLDIKTIREYFSHVNPLDKAGAYAIQEYGEMIVEKFEGSKNNIIGLPTEKLLQALKHLGSVKNNLKTT